MNLSKNEFNEVTPSNTVYKTEYIWTIDSVYDIRGKEFLSPVFHANDTNEYKWRIKMQFNNTNTNCLGLFLYAEHIGKSGTIYAQFKFALLNDQQIVGYEYRSSGWSTICTFQTNNLRSWGFSEFITKWKLYNTSELLANGKMRIYCAVMFSEKNDFVEKFDHPLLRQVQSFRDFETLSGNFESLLSNEDFSDVILSVNNKQYRVHKAILAARSPVFNAMFKHNMKESETNCIEISDLDETIVEQMLRYIYTGKCEYDRLQELADSLLVAADKYDLEALKLKCEKILSKNLSIENAVKTLILADMHGANNLKSSAISFIMKNTEKMLQSASWEEMGISYPQLLNEVFKASISKQS